MTKTCPICGHTAELTWRNGEYHCAACDSVVSEYAPQSTSSSTPQAGSIVDDVTCPICKNSDNNRYIGGKYRCALCGTTFDKPFEETYSYYQSYSNANPYLAQQVAALKEEKSKYLKLAIVFLFLFYPVSFYFFYKLYKTNKELKALGY